MTNIIANVITVILCTFGNSLVIISLKKFEWLRVASNYFVGLLAFYDFCSGLTISSLLVIKSFLNASNVNITVEYEVICKLYIHLAMFSGYGNLLCVIIITVDRYIYINWPLRYYEVLTNRKAFVISAVCFVITNLVLVFTFYDHDVVKPCTALQMARFDVIVYVVIPTILVAFLLVIILYGQIAWLAYKAKKSVANQMTFNGQSRSQKRTTKVISLVVGVFIATHLVYFTGFITTRKVNNSYLVWIQTMSIWLWQVSNFVYKNFTILDAFTS